MLPLVLASLLTPLAALAAASDPPAAAAPDLGRFFGGLGGTFVLLDDQTGDVLRHDAERARTRFLPASTFKIPNSLIALETGVASGPDFFLAWDPKVAPREPWWPEVWARDHTLRTALPASAVWYYQELARRIGPERMRSYLERFDYGNRQIGGGIDRFWLSGDLAISAEEQVRFLRRFHRGELGASARSSAIVKELLVLEETPAWRLSGKTGWVGLGDGSASRGRQIGWLVGWVERGANVHFFALNIDLETSDDAKARLAITKAILSDRGLLGDG